MPSTKRFSVTVSILILAGIGGVLFWMKYGPSGAGDEAWRDSWNQRVESSEVPAVSREVPAGPDGLPLLSAEPSDAEIAVCRAFASALLPVDDPAGNPGDAAAQNAALAVFLREYRILSGEDAWARLRSFTSDSAAARWRPALQLEVSAGLFARGFFTASRSGVQELWDSLKDRREVNACLIADLAAARMVDLDLGTGNAEALRKLILENEGRPYHGTLEGKLMRAGQAAWLLGHTGAQNVMCGPRALNSILDHKRADYQPILLDRITGDYIATGLPMSEVQTFAGRLGWESQMARRSDPAAPIPVPAVIHAKHGHYAALLEADVQTGQYFLEDRGLGFSGWISREAVDEMSSGNFVIAAGAMPAGFSPVGEAEGAEIFGRDGAHGTGDTGEAIPGGETTGGDNGSCQGMARYTFLAQTAAIRLMDNPVGYSPPVGPEARFTLTYHDIDEGYPAAPGFANAGRMWSVNWIAWLVPPSGTLTNASQLKLRVPGGGSVTEVYDTATQQFGPHDRFFSVTRKISATRYERALPDGSMEIYATPNNAANPTLVMLTQYLDRSGNALSFTYDSSLRLTRVTDAIGQITVLDYNHPTDPLKITAVRDPFSLPAQKREATLSYNAAGQLISITDVIGLVSSFTYAAAGDRVATLTTPYGTSTFTVTGSLTTAGPSTRLVEVTDPKGDRERVLFSDVDSGGPAVPGTVNAPPRTAFVAGQKVFFYAETDRLQFRNSFYWGKIAMATAPGDTAAARNYRWLSNKDATVSPILEAIKEPLEDRVWFNYPGMSGAQQTNDWGYPNYPGKGARPDKVVRMLPDGSPQILQMSYNRLGLPTKTVDPLGRTTEYAYAANGLDLTEVRQTTGGASLRLSTLTYNSKHLPLTITDQAGQTTTLTYNARGQVLTVKNANNEVTTFAYNTAGYLTGIDGPLAGTGDTTVFTYDTKGRSRTVTGPDGYMLTYDYDDFDRISKVTYPDATFEQFGYARLDRISYRDRRARTTFFEYNALQQVVKSTDPLNRSVLFDWCKCGDLKSLTDPLGRMTRWIHDVQGRVVAKQYADGSKVSYLYEPQTSRLAQRIDEKNQTTLYSYNLDNTLRSVSYPDAQVPTPTVSFLYDSVFNRIAVMTDGIGTSTYLYNPITSTAAPGAGMLGSVDGPWANDTITYTYDKLGRAAGRSINGTAQTISFDAAGRPAAVTNPLGTFTYAYVPNTARPLSVTHSGGLKTEYTWQTNAQDRRLSRIRNLKPGGAAALSTFDYSYDTEGQIKTWTQQADSAAAQTWELTYDNADQLAAAVVKQGAATVKSSAWEYDAAANRTKETIGAAAASFNYNSLNEMTHSTAALPAAVYEWDAENRLTAVVQGTARSEFVYDGLGRRVKIIEKNGATVLSTSTWLWDGLHICERRDSTGGVPEHRYYGQGFQGVSGSAAGIHLYTFDHLGSIREITDSSGNVEQRISYDAWGLPAFSNSTFQAGFAFTGHFWHARSNLHLAPFRAYSAHQGRWISRDPLGESEGSNIFRYVSNSPVMGVDPLGLFELDIGAAVQGFAEGALMAAAIVVGVALLPAELAVVAVGGLAVAGVYGLHELYQNWSCMSDQEKSHAAGNLAGGAVGGRLSWVRRPVTVYRGVHAGHPEFPNAVRGQAYPMGGHSSPILHNAGNNASIYTSWTTNRAIAVQFAGKDGIVLQQRVPANQLIRSPDKFAESEVLRPGPIFGAKPTKP